MNWEDILKRVGSADPTKIKTILDVAEKLHGKDERLQLEEEIDNNDSWANTVIKDLLKEIKTAMDSNEGKEYQELKDMQRSLERLK